MARDKKIDSLRGFAILLVVLGHAIQSYVVQYDDNLVFRIIYAFHMPLFMFLSGYLYKDSLPLRALIAKKFNQLVIPFLAWYIVTFVFFVGKVDFVQYFYRLIIHVDHGLWFLWVLFLNFCFMGIILKARNDFLIFPAIIVLKLIPVNILGLGLLKWHFPFFAMGYLAAKYRKLPVQIGFIFPLLVLAWYRVDPPAFWPYLTGFLASHDLSGDSLLRVIRLTYSYLVAFSGIGFAYLVVRKNPLFSWLGVFSLDIYVSHQIFLKFSLGEGWVRVCSSFVISLLISLGLSFFIIRRVDILTRIFLGRGREKQIRSAQIETV